MITLKRGQKIRLSELTTSTQLQVRLATQSNGLSFDFSCFGLDESGQLSDDRYFVFYNQTESPQNEIKISITGSSEARFQVDLGRLPSTVRRLVFVATIDGGGNMSSLGSGSFGLRDRNGEGADFSFVGSDFTTEKAVMVGEIYFKGEWRVAANGQGFAEGLNAVLRHFGGEEIEDSGPTTMELAPKSPSFPPAVDFVPESRPEMRKEPVIPVENAGPVKSVNLQKSQSISLSKMVPTGLTRIALGLGWDPAQRGTRVDLDGSCIAFDDQKKVIETIWFGHLQNRDGSIKHSGDNLTGRGDGDDEVISINLQQLSPQIKTLVFTINSFCGQKFSSLKNAFCRVVNAENRVELARYDLNNAGNVTGMIMAKVEKVNGEWQMTAIGEPAGGITVHFLIKAVRKHI